MAKLKTAYGEFVADAQRRRLLERESLAFEATELVSRLMEEQDISKAQLAGLIGKSRAYVTQLLSGSRNMTLHTSADLAFALGHRIGLRSVPLHSVRDEHDCVMSYDVASNWLTGPAFVNTTSKKDVIHEANEDSFAHVA
jgi:transcriptional regulator with XRE-family HTH domain